MHINSYDGINETNCNNCGKEFVTKKSLFTNILKSCDVSEYFSIIDNMKVK